MKKIKLRKTEKKLDSIKLKTDLYNKGITLIALVVTIIILLILAGVTLNMAMSGDGLFSKARDAADKYKKAQEDEQDLISEIGKEMNSEYVGAFVIGYTPNKVIFTNDKKTVPDEIASAITTFENAENETGTMKWRIWDFDGKVLRLISETPTTTTLELYGVDDYNYGVYEMNQICRDCFGVHDENNGLKSGISVSNLKRSDIQRVSSYDYTKSYRERY